jgi:hypothetical protein
MKTPPTVSPQEWRAAREQLLVKEKELTRARDALAAERRRMPWLAVDKEYRFEGPAGQAADVRICRCVRARTARDHRVRDDFRGRRASYLPDAISRDVRWTMKG